MVYSCFSYPGVCSAVTTCASRRGHLCTLAIETLAATNLLGCLVKCFVMKPCHASLEEAKWALQTPAYGNHVMGVKLYKFYRIEITCYIGRALGHERPRSFIVKWFCFMDGKRMS